jgi:hypothetical protein
MLQDSHGSDLMAENNRNYTPALRVLLTIPSGRCMAGTAANSEREKHGRGWQLDRIRDLLPIVFPPDGRVPSSLTLKAVKARLAPVFEKNGLKEPSTDSIARALGRREHRG